MPFQSQASKSKFLSSTYGTDAGTQMTMPSSLVLTSLL
uniref:Uncharacterized protein n=1 Tax=Arundo donax TaxID=35708 RepID=A0A0A9BVS7_ARUDO